MRDGILLYGNNRAETQYGISREQGIGQPADRFYQGSAERDRFIEHLQKNGRVDDLEVGMVTMDGHPFWALVSASIVDFEHEPVIFAAINDITARKHMEDEIRQLNTDLEQRVSLRTAELATANKELETFTYTVSHDLKAPLRGIDGYSRLLLEQYQAQLNDEGRLFLNNVRHGVEQMGLLIEDLLAYSRMERRSLVGQSVNLARLVASILDERRKDIEARGMIVETQGLQELTARADPEGLTMVLRNLLDNALKFTRDSHPPTLTIRGTSAEKSVILELHDNGIGFDMQFHDRIFDIFQRLQRAEDYPGTGVGLAIVRKAMQRMGGRVWAESAPGQGATFNLEIPR
jgi:PAS domain S-box-containing protein